APGPLVGIHPQPEEQRRILAPEPLEQLDGGVGVGPGRGVADRDLPAVGERGLQSRPVAALHDGHFVPLACEIPRRAGTHHAGAENQDFHGGRLYFPLPMRTRVYADLLAFLRAACTHASQAGREVPALPFYVRESVVGWLRPSFADLLRRWPHFFEVQDSYVTFRTKPDTPQARTEAIGEVTRQLKKDGVLRGWRDESVSIST